MVNKMKISGLVGGVLLLGCSQAQADIAWSFGGSGTSESAVVGNTIVKTSGGVSATAQAWANTNNGTAGTSNAALGSNTSSGAANYKLETAYLNVYGSNGLGVKNQDASSSSTYGDLSDGTSPEHSMDNNQRYDSVLFSFDSAIDLNSVTIGWKQTDSDITILAYTGTGACVVSSTCTSNMSGKSYAQLANFGWSFVGHYADLATNSATSVNAGNIISSYWLIGAVNPLVSNNSLPSGITAGNDYMKLLALSGDKYTPPCTPGTPGCGGGGGGGRVPEPGTLLLMGAGLFGLTRFNVRRAVRNTA